MTMNSSSAFELVKGELVIYVIVKEVGSRGEDKEEEGGETRKTNVVRVVLSWTTQHSGQVKPSFSS